MPTPRRADLVFSLKEDEVNASPLQARADSESCRARSNYQDLGFFHRSGSKSPRPRSLKTFGILIWAFMHPSPRAPG
jgi:hypothetical protein